MNSLETGDILLFHGTNYWFSTMVEYVTGSAYSHVAMVVRDPTDLDPNLKGLYMIESGREHFPDAIRHRITFGVQIVDLIEVIKLYTGTIYYRKLHFSNNQTIEMQNRLSMEAILSNKIWPLIKDSPYDRNPWDLLKAGFGIKWGNNNRTDAYFCSALVCFLLEKFGLITIPTEWDLIQPKDFDNGGRIEKIMTVIMQPRTALSYNKHIY